MTIMPYWVYQLLLSLLSFAPLLVAYKRHSKCVSNDSDGVQYIVASSDAVYMVASTFAIFDIHS